MAAIAIPPGTAATHPTSGPDEDDVEKALAGRKSQLVVQAHYALAI